MADEHLPVVPGTTQQFQKYLFSDELKKKFQMAVPKWLSVDRLLRVVFSSVLKNPKLLQCTTESLMNAIMQCAQLGLEPILGRAHLIPYTNRKKKGNPVECQFQPGYQGLVDLAERSGKVETVKAHVVYRNDEFDIEYGLNERLVHRPKMDGGDRGKPMGAYTVWTRTSGVKTYSFMLLDDIYRDFRSKSQAYRYARDNDRTDTPWIENEPEMLKKSLVKRHSKLEPASVEFMEAVETDNMAEIRETSQVTLLNNLPADIDEEKDLSEAIAQFDASLPKDVDLETLQKYLAVSSEHFKISIDEIKADATENLENFWTAFKAWAAKQKPGPKLTEVDHIRKLYKGLGDKNFHKLVLAEKDEIPTWPQENQDEMAASWKKRFGDEPYPVDKEPTQPIGSEPEETKDDSKTEDVEADEDQQILDLVDGAEKGPFLTGVAIFVKCPNREDDDKPTTKWCQQNCNIREKCPSWVQFDKVAGE